MRLGWTKRKRMMTIWTKLEDENAGLLIKRAGLFNKPKQLVDLIIGWFLG